MVEINSRIAEGLQAHRSTRLERIGIWEWDLVTDAVYFSPAWKRIRGCDVEEILRTPDQAAQFIHPDDKAKRKKLLGRLRAGELEQVEFEHRVKRSDGSWGRVAERTHAICNDEGQPIRLVGCEVDVSADEKLPEVNSPSAPQVDSLPIAVARFEGNDCVYVNDYWSEQTGLQIDAALGSGWLERIHPDDLEMLLERMAAFATDPKQIDQDAYEARQVLPDGSTRWVQCHFAKEHDAAGNVAGYVGTLHNIDRVKRAEEELKELNRRLHRVLESSSIGIWEWHYADERLVWDEKMHEIYGVDVNDFRGIYSDWSDRIHPADLDRIIAEDQCRAEASQQFAQEFRIVRPNGKVRHIYSNAYTELDQHGKPMRATGVNVDITERREAEFALLESENKLQRITDHVPGMVYRYFLESDGSTGWSYVSPLGRELFRIEPSELIADGELLWQLVEPKERERLREKMLESAKNLSRYVAEFRAMIPGRGHRWFQVNSQPSKTENGGYVWDGIILDITDRKTAESALLESENKLQRIADHLPGIVYRYFLNSDGTDGWSYVSPQVRELLGVAPSEVIANGDLIWQLIDPDDVARIRKGMEVSANNFSRFEGEFRVTIPGRGTRWFQANSQPKKVKNGGFVWDGVLLEITDRKTAEIELQEAKLQMERITKNVPGVIYQFVLRSDGTHSVAFISSQCRDMYGWTAEELMGDVDRLFESIHPEDVDGVLEEVARSAKRLEPLKLEYRVSIRGKGLRWHQSIGRPLRTENGDTVWNGMVLDITARKEVELANDVLAKATKTKDEFLANMSHELRTPLTAILAMTEGLQQGMFGETTPKQMESLKIVEQSGVHLLDLINEVLDLAKIESGQTELKFSNVDVSELCQSCLNLVSQQAEQKQIELSLGVPWNLPKVGADEKRIRQVLINLLGNAVKFTPHGGQVKLEIETLASATGPASETLRISISDTGIGIKDDQLDSLFEPFVQGDSSLTRQHGGTGLGLSLVKQFVELHQGKVHVTSKPDQGSCFIVDLPFRKTKLEHPELADRSTYHEQNFESENSNAEPKNISTTPHEFDGEYQPLILLAEDNDLVAQSMIPILEFHKFRVIRAVNGRLAIEMAQKHSPDLILMDVQMPEMDGLEATRHIRAIVELSKLPIIAVSGFAKLEDSRRCIEAGMNLFMAKPLRLKELVSNINNLLNAQKISADSNRSLQT